MSQNPKFLEIGLLHKSPYIFDRKEYLDIGIFLKKKPKRQANFISNIQYFQEQSAPEDEHNQ